MDMDRFALLEIDDDNTVAPAQAPVVKAPIGFQAPVARAVQAVAAAVAVAKPPALAPLVPTTPGWSNTGFADPAEIIPPIGQPTTFVAPEAYGIDTEARDRAHAADTLAIKAGLRFKEPTLFAWGTRMIGSGVAAHKRARAELSAQPLMSTLAADAAALVSKEARRGDVTTLDALSYGSDDKLRTRAGSAGVPVGVQSLKQLMVRADAPGGGYLADDRLDGHLRAPHVTHWLDLHRDGERELLKAAQATNALRVTNREKALELPEAKRVKLLSKLDGNGERTLYGVVGPKYPHTYGMDAVIRDVMAGLPGDVRGSLFYDASTTKWRVDAALGTEFTPCVGDLHRVGLKFGSHDAGGGSYWASLYAIRVRCVNFTQISAGKKLGRVKHVGSVEALRDRVKALIDVGAKVITEYSDLWAEANQTALIADSDAAGGDARAVFRALIEAGHLPAPDGREQAVENYFNAWLVEPGTNRSDYVNAATRAAHEAPWTSPWATDEIEESASQMVYQHVCLNMGQIEGVL